jgi:mannobiose 2-epimerase
MSGEAHMHIDTVLHDLRAIVTPRRLRSLGPLGAALAAALVGALMFAAPSRSLSAQPRDLPDRLVALRPRIEQNLRENIIRFWYPRSVDRRYGGYTVHYGPKGEALPGGTKMIVTQARMLWLSARLLRGGFAPDLHDAADTGFRFLRDRMWDAQHGGFYWEVDPTGREVRQANKHLYGQAFGLYALSEYASATGNRDALALANRLFDLLEAKAYDRQFGGYREFFARDWSAVPAGVNGYLGAPPDMKLMNTHLHLLEAMTSYVRAGGRPLARDRLSELIAIETQSVVRKGWVACTDRYRRDWTPILDETANRVSYGHDLENIWLVADALRALDRPTAPYHDLFRELFDYSFTYGHDAAQGGFFESGPPKQSADRRNKIWWVQAEALVSALTMWQLTGEARYAEVFERSWQWVDQHQTDWDSGEWFEAVQPDGQPRATNKATPWKAGYHNGRALVELLERLSPPPPPPTPAR